ncbi:MAG: A/G-specific adenine glycosylase [Burkholderiaceae bacterium]
MARSFAQRLLSWARVHGRRGLPWQPPQGESADPYAVWLSEIMLQQTQLMNALSYYQRFVARFPTVDALAAAELDQVLAVWSGLGYYARARNLHAAARLVVAAGGFPQTAQAWSELPGVGPSTAAAIASVVHRERVAILDGNVKRVLARYGLRPEPWNSPALTKALWPVAQSLVPRQSSDMPAYTQAIMDLGATVCTPRQPNCSACPVQADCQAHRQGLVEAYPKPAVRKARPVRASLWTLAQHENSIALVQNSSRGLWGGLWVLPAQSLDPLDLQHQLPNCDQQITHDFTHYRLQIGVVLKPCRGHRPRRIQGQPVEWFDWRAALEMGLPKPVRQAIVQATRELNREVLD